MTGLATTAVALPVVPASVCTGLLDPICQAAGSIGSTVLSGGASDVLGAVATWVVDGASWLLGQIGGALSSSTTVDLGAGWYTSHYQAMVGLAGVVVLPLLLLSVVQAVYRQSASALIRVVAVQLPLAALLAAVAVQLVQLSLAATDALGVTVSSGVGGDIQQALSGVAGTLVSQAAGGPGSAPAFVILLGALLVASGAFLLWVELLVRAAAVYVAVLFLPLALASLVWPAISHWCRRLVDTLVALVLAKFVIVAVLSLAAAAVASGTQAGFASVLGGGALLLLAAFTPFTLLRLIPAVEAGAVHQLEGARHRVQQAAGSMPRSAAAYALRAPGASSLVTGEPGTGLATAFEAPGDDGGGPGDAADDGGDGEGVAGPGGGPVPAGAGGTGLGGRPDLGGSGSGGGSGRSRQGGAPDGTASTPAVQGPPGIPQWRGVPVTDVSLDTLPAPERPPWTLADPLGRGPLPVWGGPVPELGPGDPADAAHGPWDGLVVEHDELGPVARWDRPAGSGGDGQGTDGGDGDRGGIDGA